MRRIIRGVDKFTIRSGDPFIVGEQPASANLIQYHTEQSEHVRANGLTEPLPTADSSNRYGLVLAHLTEYYGNGQPIDLREPLRTITSHDREALTAVHLQEYYDCTAEINTGHWPDIRSLLNEYCGYSFAENEIILFTIFGKMWFISDISLRMLAPKELYAAMGFPDDYIIDRDYTGKPYPKTQQVARCGNAVCPQLAAAVVRANLQEWDAGTITTMEELRRKIVS